MCIRDSLRPGTRGAATARGALGWYRPSVGVPRDVGCCALVVFVAYIFSVQFSCRNLLKKNVSSTPPIIFHSYPRAEWLRAAIGTARSPVMVGAGPRSCYRGAILAGGRTGDRSCLTAARRGGGPRGGAHKNHPPPTPHPSVLVRGVRQRRGAP